MKKIKRFLLKYLPIHKFKAQVSYSQEQSDRLIAKTKRTLFFYKVS